MINEMTFGIEIETTLPLSSPIRVGRHGEGLDIPQLPGWKADADPSIVAGPDRKRCEFVSPVYRGAEGLRQLIVDVKRIRDEFGAEVNSTCGFHIHVGFNKRNKVRTERLATLVANFEKAVYASTGTKQRERSHWCGGLQRYQNADLALRQAQTTRYHVANFKTKKPTVEFRAFAATLDVGTIVAQIRLCMGLVERAVTAKKATNWTARPVSPTSPIHRKGEGQTALTRLYYQLGWTKGRQPHAHGDLNAEGAPTIEESKRTLMDLARRYDAEQ